MSYFTVQINGGAGKTVAFSGVARNIKKAHPDKRLIVISGYPELLVNNPSIDRVYRLGATPYFNEDFVQGDGNIFSAIEPYNDSQFLKNENHLINIWSRLLGVADVFSSPRIFINIHELTSFRNNFFQKHRITKSILVINPFGGSMKEQPYDWNRDIPVEQAQTLVNILKQDFDVVQVGREDQIKLKNCINFHGNFRDICSLLLTSQKRILIDSFCQHAAAALGLPSTVLWITNSPAVFGYNNHHNILARQPDNFIHKIDSCSQEHNFTGTWNHYFPYNDFNLFDIQQIVQSVIQPNVDSSPSITS